MVAEVFSSFVYVIIEIKMFFFSAKKQYKKCAGRKAKRMVLQCNNGVGSNPVEGRTKI
jgi:hypothetical protein